MNAKNHETKSGTSYFTPSRLLVLSSLKISASSSYSLCMMSCRGMATLIFLPYMSSNILYQSASVLGGSPDTLAAGFLSLVVSEAAHQESPQLTAFSQ